MKKVKCVWLIKYRKNNGETPLLEIWDKEPTEADIAKIRRRYVELRKLPATPRHRCASCGGVEIFVESEELGDRTWHD